MQHAVVAHACVVAKRKLTDKLDHCRVHWHKVNKMFSNLVLKIQFKWTLGGEVTFILIALYISSVSYDSMVLTTVIAEIPECGKIAKKKEI